MPDTLALLDRLGTRLYRNALIPVVLAHAAASIPEGMGTRVLAVLSRPFLEPL